jgi:hypothetical protein
MQTNKLLALKMTENHSFPITLPPELVQQWWDDFNGAFYEFEAITATVFQTGADQELEACCDWMTRMGYWGDDGKAIPALRAARRPKLQSLKGQALEILDAAEFRLTAAEYNIILRALEQIND